MERDLHAAEAQRPETAQRMQVVTKSDAQRWQRIIVHRADYRRDWGLRARDWGRTSPRSLVAGPVYNLLMATIEISGLTKTYRVYQKQEGLSASIRGLFRRQYKHVYAVRGIDLAVEQGEFVAFLGPNGAGKTTTLKLLSGVRTPTAGMAHVLGYVPWKRENAYRRRFALVMGQKNQLWWDLPAQESFRLHQEIYRIDAAQFQRTRDELVDLLSV